MKQKEIYTAPTTLHSTIELEANLCASVIKDDTNPGVLSTAGHERNFIDMDLQNGFNETEWK